MKRKLKFVRTTLAGGILFLVPIVVVVMILGKALVFAHKIVAPLALHIPVHSIIGLRTPTLLAIAAIVLFCFFAGLLARTVLARRIIKWLDATVLSNLPGYEFFRSIGESTLGVEQNQFQQVVVARFDDNLQVGFLVERLANGLVSVFIPGAPNPYSGAVYFLTPDRVLPAGVAPQAMLKCLKRLGAGADVLFAQSPVANAIAKC
jgi:uncharacterized membrane protein